MISVEDLSRIARLKGIKNLGYAEKDYLLDIVLLSISIRTKDELVFKGGTALYKFYKLDRFSEDIDFTLRKEIDLPRLLKGIQSDLSLMGIASEMKEKKAHNALLVTLKVQGPLYQGNPQSLASIRIDINRASSIVAEPSSLRYISLYPDVPSFTLVVMQEKEIVAEKARAIITRAKARDVYDLWFLLEKSVPFEIGLIDEKLAYYDQKWDGKEFAKRLQEAGRAWDSELSRLVSSLPDFGNVRKAILEKVENG